MIKYSIVMPALNEEDYIRTPLISLNKQLDENGEIIVVDNECSDSTAEIAEHYGARVIKAPRGKLNARDAGIRAAKGEVIIATDADTYYPQGWLQKMLSYFAWNQIAGVGGNRVYEKDVWWSRFIPSRNRFFGGNSAFLKQAYLDSGGFNLNINQFSLLSMVREEELRLKKLLRKHGKVIIDRRLCVITSSRRFHDAAFKEQVKKGERF